MYGPSSRRDLGGQTSELCAFGSDTAADHDEVLRDHLVAQPAHASLEADSGDVMLPAAVGAAADLSVEPGSQRDEVGSRAQEVTEQAAQATRLRHRQAARLCPRTARHIGEGARVRKAEPRGGEPAVELRQILATNPAQYQVLVRGDPDRTVT